MTRAALHRAAQTVAVLTALLLASCVDTAPLPACTTLGCTSAPSGSPDTWEPCTDAVCFCGAPSLACEAP